MTTMTRPLRITTAALVLALAGSAAAQSPASPYPRAAALGPAAQVAGARRAVAEMQITLTAARARFEAAREAEDLVQVNCVGDKIAAIKGLLRTSEEASTALGEAIEQGAGLLADHAYTRVTVAADRVAKLRLEVESCVGETSRYAGETTIDLDVAPGVRDDDPSRTEAAPVFTAINTERPPAVSGSR